MEENFKGNKNTRKTHDKRTRVFNQLNQPLVNKTLVEKGKSNDISNVTKKPISILHLKF